MKEAAYKVLEFLVLEYGSSVLGPSYYSKKRVNIVRQGLCQEIVYETGCMAGILGQLQWASLKETRIMDNKKTSHTSSTLFYYFA